MKNLFIICCLIGLWGADCFAQLHLQTDRQAYATGDTLWYAVQVPRHTSDSSVTLIVDLIDSYQRTITTQKRPLVLGQAHGAIILSDTLPRGSYRLRVYSWTGEQGFSLFWITARSVAMALATPIDSAVVVKCYPEGGGMVEGLPSRVAVVVQSLDGQGVSALVKITDTEANVVAQTATDARGLGQFVITPRPQTSYVVTVVWRDSLRQSGTLPVVRAEGVVLQVDGQTIPTHFKIRLFKKKPSTLSHTNLLGYVGDSLYFATSDSSSKPVLTVQIPKSNFPKGLVRFAVTDSKNQILAERWSSGIVPAVEAEVVPDKKNYKAGEEVSLQLTLGNSSDQSLQGIGSIVVIDSTQEMYYAAATNKVSDTLLMTHAHYEPPFLNTGKNLWIMLQVLNEQEKPLPFANLLLLETTSKRFCNTTTDEQGYFKIEGITHERDTLNWVIQRISGKNRAKKTTLRLVVPPKPVFEQQAFPSLMQKTKTMFSSDTTLEFRDGTTLADVRIKARRYIEREYYSADFTWDINDKFLANAGVTSGLNLINYLKMMDPRFTRSRVSRNRGFTSFESSASLMQEASIDPFNRPLENIGVVIDRQFFPDVENRLAALSAYDIQRVDVVRSFTKPLILASMMNLNSYSIVIAITTRLGPYGNGQYTLNQTVSKITVPGYTPPMSYGSRLKKAGYQPTVYWNSLIVFPTSIRFSTKATPTCYRVLVRGITSEKQYFEKIIWINTK